MKDNYEILICQDNGNQAPQALDPYADGGNSSAGNTSSSTTAVTGDSHAGAGGGQPQGMESWIMWVILIGMIAVFYLLIIRPQQKRQKDLQKQISALSNGDRVLTTGGLYGTVVKIKEHVITLKVSDSTKVEINKGYVASVVGKEETSSSDS